MILAKIRSNFFSKENILFAIPVLIFLGSVYQGQYIFDEYHWGLLSYNAKALVSEKKLYEEIFIHYGILTTVLNSIILGIFNFNLLFLFGFYSFFYAFAIYLITKITLKLSNLTCAFLIGVALFFVHPFIEAPWHNYLLFLIIIIYIYSKIFYKFFFAETLLAIGSLVSESFFVPSLFILFFSLIYKKIYWKENLDFKEIFFKIIIFFSIFVLFYLWLQFTNKIVFWENHQKIPAAFLEILKIDFYTLIKFFFVNLINYGIQRFWFEPQWFIFLLIFIFNVFFLIFIFFKKNNSLRKEVVYISFISIILCYNTVHSFSIFKFSTGLIIGLIPVFIYIKNIKNYDTKIIISFILSFIFLNCLSITYGNNNRNYVLDYKKEEFIENKSFVYFKNQKWDQRVWDNLIQAEQHGKYFKKKCNITYFANLSKNAFYNLIFYDQFIIDQKIPWYEFKDRYYMNNYYSIMAKYFDTNLFENIKNRIATKNIIIIANRENYPEMKIDNKYLQFSNNMNFVNLPYSKQTQNMILIYPKNCNF